MKEEGLSDHEVKRWNIEERSISVRFVYFQKLEKRHLHAAKETEYLRLKRVKMSADDFQPLKVIGRGGFGEVNDRAFATAFDDAIVSVGSSGTEA